MNKPLRAVGTAGGAGPVAGKKAVPIPQGYLLCGGWVGMVVDPHGAGRETEALTLAAWGSFARHQREAEHWLKLFEQRVARLSEPEKELVRRRTGQDLSP